MSIHDKEHAAAKQEQQKQDEQKQAQEETNSQPDLVAQVLVFLLKECKQNNPDSRRECDHLTKELVEEFGSVDADIIPATPAKAETAAASAPPIVPRLSRRFRR